MRMGCWHRPQVPGSLSHHCTPLAQALHYAKDRGALCIGITNTVGSAIARHTDCGVHINAGCEIGVASTKAYTSQMVVITMMALALSEDSIAKRPKRDAVIDALGTLPAKLRRVRSINQSDTFLVRGTCQGASRQSCHHASSRHDHMLSSTEARHRWQKRAIFGRLTACTGMLSVHGFIALHGVMQWFSL